MNVSITYSYRYTVIRNPLLKIWYSWWLLACSVREYPNHCIILGTDSNEWFASSVRRWYNDRFTTWWVCYSESTRMDFTDLGISQNQLTPAPLVFIDSFWDGHWNYLWNLLWFKVRWYFRGWSLPNLLGVGLRLNGNDLRNGAVWA